MIQSSASSSFADSVAACERVRLQATELKAGTRREEERAAIEPQKSAPKPVDAQLSGLSAYRGHLHQQDSALLNCPSTTSKKSHWPTQQASTHIQQTNNTTISARYCRYCSASQPRNTAIGFSSLGPRRLLETDPRRRASLAAGLRVRTSRGDLLTAARGRQDERHLTSPSPVARRGRDTTFNSNSLNGERRGRKRPEFQYLNALSHRTGVDSSFDFLLPPLHHHQQPAAAQDQRPLTSAY